MMPARRQPDKPAAASNKLCSIRTLNGVYTEFGIDPQEAFEDVVSMFLSKKNQVFKTVTGDNVSEFATLADFEKYGMSVYFTHPYTSCEKGTNECHNKMLRRFIPKGKPISSYTAEDICYFADCINGLPRKILGYRTPEELFEQELDKIYAA